MADEIEIVLDHLDELFVPPSSDPFAAGFSSRSGVDRCLTQLRSRRGTEPVPVRIVLPADQIAPDAGERVRQALVRWCDEQVTANRLGRRAARLDGWSSLKIGVPVTIAGFALVATSSEAAVGGPQEVDDVLLEHLGWVISWVGLWFPVDALVFGPLLFGRESRAWRRLRDAPLTLVPRPAEQPAA